MWFDLSLILIGLILLFYGGDVLVSSSIRIARHFSLPPFVIGATIMGFGTSAPELCVSLLAAISGSPEVSLGNVVGSNIANIGLVLGITALLAPVAIDPRRFKKESLPLLLATGLLLIMTWNQMLSRVEGLVLLACILTYLVRAITSKEEAEESDFEDESRYFPASGLGIQLGLVCGGLTGLVLGAHWMVQGAVSIARANGISEWLIGITIVAVGTSLPEIISSTLSALKGHGEMALGNVFGSNIFNITMVLGATASIQPLEIISPIKMDMVYCAGITLILMALIMRKHRLLKLEGGILLAGYVCYIVVKSAGWA